ncbi:hypothetical protein ACLOJK_021234 [Asimina triloba]
MRLNSAAAMEDIQGQFPNPRGPTIAMHREVKEQAIAMHREVKEQDLLRLLDDSSSEDPNTTVDCTLKLGLPSATTSSRPLIKDQNSQFDGQHFSSPAKVHSMSALPTKLIPFYLALNVIASIAFF